MADQVPFYKAAAFWVSIVALIIATVSFLNCSIFGPDIHFSCTDPDSQDKSFTVRIANNGNRSAEDVILSIATANDGDKAKVLQKLRCQEYSFQCEPMWVKLKFPVIAPHSVVTLVIRDCTPSRGTTVMLQKYAIYVVHKTGVGRCDGQ
jgi:hypothetical protein